MSGSTTRPSTYARRPRTDRHGRGCSAARRTTQTRASPSSWRTSTTPSRQTGTVPFRAGRETF
eukprot:13987333-Alexandrium_andersonii.AAC.1